MLVIRLTFKIDVRKNVSPGLDWWLFLTKPTNAMHISTADTITTKVILTNLLNQGRQAAHGNQELMKVHY